LRSVAILLGVMAVAGSGCAVGVRQPAFDITESGATLRGNVLSTTGGSGKHFMEYREVIQPSNPATERTPVRSIDFVANEAQQVYEPVDGLAPGRGYLFRVCAEDSENPGDPFCSPFQGFTTSGDSVQGTGIIDELEMDPRLTYSFTFDLGSRPSGRDLSGFGIVRSYSGRGALGTPIEFSVRGNRAQVTFVWKDSAGVVPPCFETLIVEDGGPGGTDRIAAPGGGTSGTCSQVGEVLRGDIVVTDAEPPPSAR